MQFSTLAREVGLKEGAAWVLAEGADAAVMTRSIPMEKLLKDGLIAYAQNGEALRPEQGYPLRLILPGWEGNTHIKWLRRLELSDKPFMTREETSKYTDLLGERKSAPIQLRHGGEVGHHVPVRRDEASRSWFLQDYGASPGAGAAACSRSTYRSMAARPGIPRVATLCGADLHGAVPIPMVLERRAGAAAEPGTDETGYVQPTLKQLVAIRGSTDRSALSTISTPSRAGPSRADGSVSNVHA